MMEHPKEKAINARIDETLEDYQMSVESMMIEGLTIAVRQGRMSEETKQEVLNEYVTRRNADKA